MPSRRVQRPRRVWTFLLVVSVLALACVSTASATGGVGTAVTVVNLPPDVERVDAHVTPDALGGVIHATARVDDGNNVRDVTRVVARLVHEGTELDRVEHVNPHGHGVAHHAWAFRVLAPGAYEVHVRVHDGFGLRAAGSTIVHVEHAPEVTETADDGVLPPLVVVAGSVVTAAAARLRRVTSGGRSRT